MEIYHDEYSNPEITVRWDQSKCIHAGVCYTELGKVFNPLRRPCIDVDQASAEEIMKVVEKCPTGALTAVRNRDKGQTASEAEKKEQPVEQPVW